MGGWDRKDIRGKSRSDVAVNMLYKEVSAEFLLKQVFLIPPEQYLNET